MMKKILPGTLLILLFTHAGVYAFPAAESDSLPAVSDTNEQRPWTVGLPIWVPGYMNGQFTIGGIEIEGESDEENIFDQIFLPEYGLEFYLVALVNYRWQQWKFHFDLFGGSLSNSVTFSLTDKTVVDASLLLFMPHLHAGYDFLHDTSPLGPIYNWQVYVGSRLYNVNMEVNLPESSGETDNGHTWLSLLIGTELNLKIVKQVDLRISGDIGGLTANDKWAFFGQASLNYQPWPLFSANLGIAMLHLEGEKPENELDFSYELDLLGPTLGVAFHF